jgi:hypothetical protein
MQKSGPSAAAGSGTPGSGRLRKSEDYAGEPAADACFQRRWLQPNGFQLAIRSALLSARSGCAGHVPTTVGTRHDAAAQIARHCWSPRSHS